MGLFDIILIIGGIAVVGWILYNMKDEHGDPACMFDDNCRVGMPGYATPACYPCGYPA